MKTVYVVMKDGKEKDWFFSKGCAMRSARGYRGTVHETQRDY